MVSEDGEGVGEGCCAGEGGCVVEGCCCGEDWRGRGLVFLGKWDREEGGLHDMVDKFG